MHPVFRAFKRHFHKVRKLVPLLDESGPFNLEIRFDGHHLQARNTTPSEGQTVRFVVLMRRFLNPSDGLYYRNVWGMLQEEFAEELPSQSIGAIESSIERLKGGYVRITINDDTLTAERVYQVLSEAEYFGRDEESQRYLEGLSSAPIVGPLFWSQFYTYTLAGFDLVSRIFSIILEVEESEKYKNVYSELPATEYRCIYCLSTSVDFTSEEHIFPESLGNDELVLPKGYVCDTCNNRVLSTLDSVLLGFEPIAFLQVQFVPYTKAGKLPQAKFQNVWFEKTRPRHIRMVAQDKSGLPQDRKDIGNGWVSFNVSMQGKRFDPKSLARSLYKIGLGLVALSQGHEQACDSRYDEARDFILSGRDFPNNLLMCTKCNPTPQVTACYRNLSPGTPVVISVYGLIFKFNLETDPTMSLNEQLTQLHFESYALGE